MSILSYKVIHIANLVKRSRRAMDVTRSDNYDCLLCHFALMWDHIRIQRIKSLYFFRGKKSEGLLNFLDTDATQLWLWKLRLAPNLVLTCKVCQFCTNCVICRGRLLAQTKSPILFVFHLFQWGYLNRWFLYKQLLWSILWKIFVKNITMRHAE